MIFEVWFTSAMTDADLGLLRRRLDMTTHRDQKMRPDPNSPGVARLDHWSGLFLERGANGDQWVLQGRTWGTPSAAAIHGWHLCAAQTARALDPRVRLPEHSLDLDCDIRR